MRKNLQVHNKLRITAPDVITDGYGSAAVDQVDKKIGVLLTLKSH